MAIVKAALGMWPPGAWRKFRRNRRVNGGAKILNVR
jgi:hypothetical protein